MATLTDEQVQAAKSILEYLWEREAEDYAEMSENKGESCHPHIFHDMVKLDQAIYGHKSTPEELLKEINVDVVWEVK